jgi:O-antigen/teichoic acid export membrane protein
MTDPDASRMLAEVQAANAELAKRAVAPIWYHPALGLMVGGLIAVQGSELTFLGAYYAVFSIGLVMLMAAYKKHTGLWINGYRPGRTRVVAIGLAVAVTLIMWGSLWLHRSAGVTWAMLLGGGVSAVITTAGGFVWEAAFRRDLRDGGSL